MNVEFGIEAVISAVKGKNLDNLIPRHIEYLYIPAVDHESFDISVYFEESNKFIDEERKRTNVLVHCMAGISRSVTLIMAYLMKYENKSFDEAYHFMKVKRKIVVIDLMVDASK
jgi:protein-tyrosine phosphatase